MDYAVDSSFSHDFFTPCPADDEPDTDATVFKRVQAQLRARLDDQHIFPLPNVLKFDRFVDGVVWLTISTIYFRARLLANHGPLLLELCQREWPGATDVQVTVRKAVHGKPVADMGIQLWSNWKARMAAQRAAVDKAKAGTQAAKPAQDLKSPVPVTARPVPAVELADELAVLPTCEVLREGDAVRIFVEDIQRAAARCYGVTRAEICSNRRVRTIVKPRQVAMYLCKTLTPRSLPEIGRRFGGKNHTTVLHAVRKIGQMRGDAGLERELSLITQWTLQLSQRENSPADIITDTVGADCATETPAA
jgi:hypothetical protein